MVFNVVAQNCDDHTKNFSFRLKQNSKWELAPAYDICHAYHPDNKWVHQHALSVNGKRKDIKKVDLLTIAKSSSIHKPEDIINEIIENVKQWKEYANEVKVSPKLRDEIAKTLFELK